MGRIRPLMPRLAAGVVAIAALSMPAEALAQAEVRGKASGNYGPEGTLELDFVCSGTPTCVGTYTGTDRFVGCSNGLTIGGRIEITGLNLATPGSLAGQVTLGAFDYSWTQAADGSCTIDRTTFSDSVSPYTGTWDGRNGAFRIVWVDLPGFTIAFNGTFTANLSAPPPVFPMTVNAQIDSRTANAVATFQPRPQDAGTSANVYVFAVAPASVVKNASAGKLAHYDLMSKASADSKADPVPCVIAQLNASGQLQGVSASNLQAALSGVLTAQGQSVTLLNNVSTPNVAGATFFVGYGASASAMISGGINRSAVTVPGPTVCKPEAPQTGWWWNPAEDGRGFSLEVRGNNIFFASFLYDVSGRSTWYVSSGPVSLDGSLYNGDLLGASGGQTLGGAYPGRPALSNQGPMTLGFNTATTGTMAWPGGIVPIQRFDIVPNGRTLPNPAGTPENGWWWNEEESGRGFFLEWQAGTLDIAGYMYDEQGNSVWYLTVGTMTTPGGNVFSGNWWSYGNGQTLTGAWRPNTRLSTNVAPLTVTFSGPDTAIMTLPNGRTTALKRHRF